MRTTLDGMRTIDSFAKGYESDELISAYNTVRNFSHPFNFRSSPDRLREKKNAAACVRAHPPGGGGRGRSRRRPPVRWLPFSSRARSIAFIAQNARIDLQGACLLDFGQKKTIYVFLPDKQVQDIYFSHNFDHETHPLPRSL